MRFTVRTPASSANLGPGFDALGLALGLWNEATVDLVRQAGTGHVAGHGGRSTGRPRESGANRDEPAGTRDGPYSAPLLPRRAHGRSSSARARLLGRGPGRRACGRQSSTRNVAHRLRSLLHCLADGRPWRQRGRGPLRWRGARRARTRQSGATPHPRPARSLRGGLRSSGDRAYASGSRGIAADCPPRGRGLQRRRRGWAWSLVFTPAMLHLIAAGMHDRLHEPYRARLFPHLEVLISAARGAGALGACLSGAGPSVLALTQPDRTDAVAGAYRAAAASMGVAGEVETARRRSGGCGDRR